MVIYPIAALTKDHDDALRQLKLLEAGARDLGQGDGLQALAMVSQVLQFLDTDIRRHMALEEEALFPVLERHLGRGGGPIAVMLGEHEELWGKVAELGKNVAALKLGGGSPLRQEVSRGANYIAQLLEGHIQKENMILFPMAQEMLSLDEIAEVARKWEAISPGTE